ncbi:hypothetical protein EMCRGX_G012921 [Ephydatia muelleri]
MKQPAKKQTEERERYYADPEKKRGVELNNGIAQCARLPKRVRYGKAKRTLQNQRGHRKRTTDKVIQSYSLYEPKDIILSEYKSGLEKAILKNSTLLVQLNDAFCKTSTKVLKKVLNVRRKKAGKFLKDVRAINAIKLEDSHLLEGVRYHTAGSEPFFYDASYNHTRQLGAIPVDLNVLLDMASVYSQPATGGHMLSRMLLVAICFWTLTCTALSKDVVVYKDYSGVQGTGSQPRNGTLSFHTPTTIGLYCQGYADPTQLCALGIIGIVLAHFSLSAADPLLAPASFNVVELSGETTVRSKAAGFPIIQLGTRMSAGLLSELSAPYP